MRRAAEGFRIGLEPTGDAAENYPLEAYADVDEWATAVMEHLSEEHQAQCTAVHLNAVDALPCSRCTGGCRNCVFWRAVRYWRNIETGGKAAEGYNKKEAFGLKGSVWSPFYR